MAKSPRTWRGRRDKQADVDQEPAITEDASNKLPEGVFVGQLRSPKVHFDVLDQCVKELSQLRQDLTPYVDGIESVDINPFLVLPEGQGAVALDALIIRR